MGKIREVLADRSRWTQDVMARDSEGHEVRFGDKRATCFCLLALADMCYPNDGSIKQMMYAELAKRGSENSISKFNDTHTYEEVLEFVTVLDV